jgi:diguanylate cyclase (GGDEF)-like protein
MPDRIKLLHRLAGTAIDSPASNEGLGRIVDLVREAIGASHVYLVYTEDKEFLVRGDSGSNGNLVTSQMGLWLVQHQIKITDGPVAFNVDGERVVDLTSALDADHQTHLGFPVHSGDATEEMLIVEGLVRGHVNFEVPAFVEAATPALALVLDRVLSAARANRQREQMMALANAAQLLIQAEHVEPVLEDLATAISRASGYDLVNIDVYDQAGKRIAMTVLNRTPQVRTSLGEAWMRQAAKMEWGAQFLEEVMSLREPRLDPDLQKTERIPENVREFLRQAHIFSSGQFPIRFHDENLGMLRVVSQRPREFTSQDVEVVSGFAAQLAVALKSVDMYKSLGESERQLRQYAEQLQAGVEVQHRLARTDALTGVPNRRYVDEATKGECARAVRHRTPLCVAMVDIDRFKDINDTYGHKAGDEALMQLADLARRSCRRGDVVGRYGGDEFLFVLPEADLGGATRFVNRFRTEVAGHIFVLSSNQSLRMKVSAGVAKLGQKNPQKPSVLVKEADEALYEAKEKGRNKTCCYRSARKAA